MTQDLNKFLEQEEGRVLHAYKDVAGVWTIGVGSITYKDGTPVKKGDVITNEQADELRDWEVGLKTKAIQKLLGSVVLKDNQMVALISFTYNEGEGALAASSLLRTIRKNPNDQTVIPIISVEDRSVRNYMAKHSWDEVNIIRMDFMMWNKAKDPKTGIKQYNESLMQRRLREANLYLS